MRLCDIFWVTEVLFNVPGHSQTALDTGALESTSKSRLQLECLAQTLRFLKEKAGSLRD